MRQAVLVEIEVPGPLSGMAVGQCILLAILAGEPGRLFAKGPARLVGASLVDVVESPTPTQEGTVRYVQGWCSDDPALAEYLHAQAMLQAYALEHDADALKASRRRSRGRAGKTKPARKAKK